MDQWFRVTEARPHSVKSAANYLGCSLAEKCFEVITLLSTCPLKEFMLSMIIAALQFEKIEVSVRS